MNTTTNPINLLSRLERLHRDCPAGMMAFLGWIETTPYGSITLRFSEGKLTIVERTETAK